MGHAVDTEKGGGKREKVSFIELIFTRCLKQPCDPLEVSLSCCLRGSELNIFMVTSANVSYGGISLLFFTFKCASANEQAPRAQDTKSSIRKEGQIFHTPLPIHSFR